MSFRATLAANAVYKISNVAVLFLTTVVLSRAMGAEGYGLISLLVLNAVFFNMLTSFGTDSGITYTTALDAKNVNRVVTVSFLVLTGQIILLIVAELVCYLLTGNHLLLKTSNSSFWWMGVLYLIGISLQEKHTALLNGSHLYTETNKVVLLCNLLSLFVYAFLLFINRTRSLDVYLIAFILSNVLPALALIVLSKSRLHFTLDFRLTKESMTLFFNYSALVFITNLIQFLAYRADLWIIAHYRNETEVGLYALAVRLAQLFWILPILFASIIFPKVSSDNDAYNHTEMLVLLRLLNAANLAAGLVLLIFIKPLFAFVFGRQFLAGAEAFQILLPGIILFCNATILAAYFAGINALNVNLWGSVLCLVSVVLLDFFLIPHIGYIGAAIASSIGYSLTGIYYVWTYCRKKSMSPSLLFLPQKTDLAQMRLLSKYIFRNS